MHETVKNLLKIQENVKKNLSNKITYSNYPKIIAVSKTFKIDHIMPLIEYGHLDYGENKVQEALEKWHEIKQNKKEIKLHLIGKLQTNKVKSALRIFDYIHSLDSKKLANKISTVQKDLDVSTKLFIQVNIGKEKQKSGIPEEELLDFYKYCISIDLNIIGLMCIPPLTDDSTNYFKRMKELNKQVGLEQLSMGMSADYLKAIENRSTHIRIGTEIFGQRG
tara:strand:+ start:827 stop:1489 length:663 start_codon:yes stop_codon:yes gene_type:complete